MNHLSKEKRTQLVCVLLCVLAALTGLWFGLIRLQQRGINVISVKRADSERRLKQMESEIRNAPQIDSDLAERKQRLSMMENSMASGDLYDWVINSIRGFTATYKVEIPQFGQIDGPKEMTSMAGFPYKQATLTVAGTATFNDFGRFVADFENQFPYFQVMNLSLEPAAGAIPDEKEKLTFRMDIVVLVKPGAS
jgi:hypothetical protein